MARRKPIVLTIAAIMLLIVIAASFFFFRKTSVSPAENTSAVPHSRIEIESTDPFEEAFVAQNADDSTEELQPSFSVDELSCSTDYTSLAEQEQSTRQQYRIIHHEAEYRTIHHDAVTIHHEAEYKIIHHEAEGHYEEVVVTPAWDETVSKDNNEQHVFCNESSCHMDFTAAGLSSSQIWDHLEAHALKGEASGHHTEDIKTIVTETVHHKAETQQIWITVKEAWDEKILIKEAWDEVRPAYDERILVKEAWDEKVPE